MLLTGASGFIGAHVLDLLCEQHETVHAVARRAGVRRDGVIWHEADLLAHGAGEQVTREARASELMHLAWYAVPGRFWTAPENERWIDASLRLLRSFGEAGGERAVIAGTCAEYAWRSEPLRESDSPLLPATLYGACKHATHVAAAATAAQLGVSLAWGRLFFIYGPGEREGRLVSSVLAALLSGGEAPSTDGHQMRDFMHVRDVAAALVALLRSEVEGAVNIASGEPQPVREIVAEIARQLGALERVRFGALQRRADEPELIAADVRRLREEVGFREQVQRRSGIGDAIEWWRGRRAGEDLRGAADAR